MSPPLRVMTRSEPTAYEPPYVYEPFYSSGAWENPYVHELKDFPQFIGEVSSFRSVVAPMVCQTIYLIIAVVILALSIYLV